MGENGTRFGNGDDQVIQVAELAHLLMNNS